MWQRLARGVLGLIGWRVEGAWPGGKTLAIGAPHTSNWDFVLFLPVIVALGVKVTWLGKDSLFRGPFGWLMRAIGGVPVVRGARLNAVEQAIERFRTTDRLVLVMSPEGTRKKTDAWKSGFYHIARGAGVSVTLCYLDFGRKAAGIGPSIMLTGDQAEDMRTIGAFYADKRGYRPEQQSTICLEKPRDAATTLAG
jgi:1-acyl-sn-glycerol-3-phosphate acyltransferase